MTTKISVVIITFNEERNLERTLQKLTSFDEIIIVDSGSTDATIAIAEKYDASVFHKDFEGFGSQKQFAVAKAKNNWILSLDADEVLTDDLVNEIKKHSFSEDTFGAYNIKGKHIFMDRVFNYGNESNKDFLRLFNKEKANFNDNKVHEFVATNYKVGSFKNAFLHYSYDSLDTYIKKLNNYTNLYAQAQFEKNKKYSVVAIIVKTKFEFFKKYILQFNFLNGKEGLYWALFSTFYMYTKCIKTNELYLKK